MLRITLVALVGAALVWWAAPALADGENVLQNAGFEGDMRRTSLSSWVSVGWEPWFVRGSQPSLNHEPEFAVAANRQRHEGGKAMRWFNSYATHHAGIAQRAPAPKGAKATFSLWMYGWSSRNDTFGLSEGGYYEKWVGIDPHGGIDALSPTVVWSAPNLEMDKWVKMEVSTTVLGDYVTVFGRGRPLWPVKHNDVIVDEASLTFQRPPEVTPASPPGEQATPAPEEATPAAEPRAPGEAEPTAVPTALSTAVPTAVPTALSTPVPTALSTPVLTPLPPTISPPTPPVPAVYTQTTYVLSDTRQIGTYAVRVWKNTGPNKFPSDDIVTISAAGRDMAQIETVLRLGSLTGQDITGEGHPDVIVETYSGGAHCCFSTIVYNLGPELTKVLETKPSNCGGRFEDLDGDGAYEFATCDDRFAYMYCPYVTSPMVRAILKYEAGVGYVAASPRFPQQYEADIAAHRELAQEGKPVSQGEWDKTNKCSVLPLVLDYLYSGQPDQARSALEQWYNFPDRDKWWAQILQRVGKSPLYAGP